MAYATTSNTSSFNHLDCLLLGGQGDNKLGALEVVITINLNEVQLILEKSSAVIVGSLYFLLPQLNTGWQQHVK